MSLVRFVHAADLHLDSPFKSLATLDRTVAGRLVQATFDAYANIIAFCINAKVDALVVAGDVFDSADGSLQAQLRFVEGLNRLDRAGIRSFICHGNHDPLDRWEARLAFPPGCHRFGKELERVPIFSDEPDRAVVYGMSYPTREVRTNQTERYRNRGKERFSIALLHANVGGDPEHEAYAPCSLDDLCRVGHDYWALGHVHTRSILRDASPVVVYPGNPQGRHGNELDARGVYLVDVDDDGRASLQFVSMDVVRWVSAEVNINGMEKEQELLDALNHCLGALRDDTEGRDLLVRMSLTGRGELHRFLTRPGVIEDIVEDLRRSWGKEDPFIFMERLEDATRPALNRDERSRAEDFVAELLRKVDALQRGDEPVEDLVKSLNDLFDHRMIGRHLKDMRPTSKERLGMLPGAESEALDRVLEDDDR